MKELTKKHGTPTTNEIIKRLEKKYGLDLDALNKTGEWKTPLNLIQINIALIAVANNYHHGILCLRHTTKPPQSKHFTDVYAFINARLEDIKTNLVIKETPC